VEADEVLLGDVDERVDLAQCVEHGSVGRVVDGPGGSAGPRARSTNAAG
jgi:hypothetical protein